MQDFSIVIRTSGRNGKSVALAVLAVAVLALGGCGRKAGLDLPPDAAAAPAAQAQVNPNDQSNKSGATASQSNLFSNTSDSKVQYAPKLPPKRIILDPILD